ncbi:hypothetical protein DFH09DRAFT_1091119 [Mycena vulgaris]|nr:hypothetical protein DFH09DRAFT_1091119 [Mycena vulgaris]
MGVRGSTARRWMQTIGSGASALELIERWGGNGKIFPVKMKALFARAHRAGGASSRKGSRAGNSLSVGKWEVTVESASSGQGFYSDAHFLPVDKGPTKGSAPGAECASLRMWNSMRRWESVDSASGASDWAGPRSEWFRLAGAFRDSIAVREGIRDVREVKIEASGPESRARPHKVVRYRREYDCAQLFGCPGVWDAPESELFTAVPMGWRDLAAGVSYATTQPKSTGEASHGIYILFVPRQAGRLGV